MAVVQPYITAFHRKANGFRPDPAYVDFLTDFAADPELVVQARSELAAAQAVLEGRPEDYETKAKHTALTRMLAQFDQAR